MSYKGKVSNSSFENATWNDRIHAEENFKRFSDNSTHQNSLLYCWDEPPTIEVSFIM